MKLIVGLGTPGEEYRLTRHNLGFMLVKEAARSNSINFRLNKRFKALTGEGLIAGERSYLAMPQTLMNLSGHSVRLIVNWLKIDLGGILVVIDDIALPFGKIRMRPKGGDAGHRGMRSVIDCLGTNGFSRMRIGIMGGRPIKNHPRYVLNRFTRKEQKTLPDILQLASQACECWVREGVNTAMNQYNSKSKS